MYRTALLFLFLAASNTWSQTSEPLGASVRSEEIEFRVFSSSAKRIELWLYDQATGAPEKARVLLTHDPLKGVWSASVSASDLARLGMQGSVYYGYRAWGSNWSYDPTWKPGSTAGFLADVDGSGARFNPNKLLTDPYARELSHNPMTPSHREMTVYASGPDYRHLDSAPVAPKGIVLPPFATDIGPRPERPFKDEILYEVHVRGLTMNDPDIPPEVRGTYRGAAMKARALRELGVTAIEFLPVHEFQNQTNDLLRATGGMDYWGYATLNFFSPSRRYAADQSPGGPTREFREMVRAFHNEGIKVYLDVVYNHTGEGNVWNSAHPETASVLSWRGLDNAAYYELSADARYYYDNNGVAGNFNAAHPAVRDHVIDSLKYWANEMGVDGFRFDLASVLGNSVARNGFSFDKMDPNNILNRAARELPHVALIAEPWAGSGDGNYQAGGFPWGWAEWNGKYRDTIRSSLNRHGVEPIPAGELAIRIAGSSDLYEGNGRRPWHSVNFVSCHDGPTLRDLFSFSSDHHRSWDHFGRADLQRQSARTAMALMMLSAGVPMIQGGDEMLRTLKGHGNAYDIDTEANWLDYRDRFENGRFLEFTRRMIEFRKAHPALRPENFFRQGELIWLRSDGWEAGPDYMRDANFLGYRIDGGRFGDSARSLYVGYNGHPMPMDVTLPPNWPGHGWYRVADTAAWMEGEKNFRAPGQEELLRSGRYQMAERSLLLLVEGPLPIGDRARGIVRAEAAEAGKFAAAYLLKEAFKGRNALADLKTPGFWGSLAVFTVAARGTEKFLPFKGVLPLAAGMAAVQLLTGNLSLQDLAISTGSFLAAGVAVNPLADGVLYPMLFRAGPPGWIAASVYTVGKLAVTLYAGEKLEAWIHSMLDRSGGTSGREGVRQKVEKIGREVGP